MIEKRELQLPKCAQNKLVFVLDGVLSEEECKGIIKQAERKGFKKAAYKMSMQGHRSSQRCIIDSRQKVDLIWSRIKSFIPEVWEGHPVVGANERLRILKYHKGDYFMPHEDGVYERPDGTQKSYITIQLYLNEGFTGGNTTFMSNSPIEEDVGVVPKTGSILVFQHDILHEGSLLEAGIKYSMRTDIMYDITSKLVETSSSSIPGLQFPGNEYLSKAQLKNKKRRENAKNKAKNEQEQNENNAPQPFVENNYQGAKGLLSDPEKEKKIRKLNDKIAAIQKIKQAQAEGKQLEKNQIEKLSKEKEFLDELKALSLS